MRQKTTFYEYFRFKIGVNISSFRLSTCNGKKLELVFGLCVCACSGLEVGSLKAVYITDSELLILSICGAPSLNGVLGFCLGLSPPSLFNSTTW